MSLHTKTQQNKIPTTKKVKVDSVISNVSHYFTMFVLLFFDNHLLAFERSGIQLGEVPTKEITLFQRRHFVYMGENAHVTYFAYYTNDAVIVQYGVSVYWLIFYSYW